MIYTVLFGHTSDYIGHSYGGAHSELSTYNTATTTVKTSPPKRPERSSNHSLIYLQCHLVLDGRTGAWLAMVLCAVHTEEDTN
eukprot:3897050-Amphidinium_carterae.1